MSIKGFLKKLMFTFAEKEAAYGDDVTISAASADLMAGYLATPEFPDEVVTNADEQHGSEMPTELDILEQGVKISYENPKCYPNELVGFCALTAGVEAESQDGAVQGWKHYITPAANGVGLASINAIYDAVNRQERYVGLKGASYEISSEEKGGVAFKCDLMGSGKREDTAVSWYGAIAETIMRAADTAVYIKPSPTPATDFIAAGSLAQDSDNISQAQNLTSIGDRVISWKFGHNNNMEEIRGHGGVGYNQDLDFGAREYTFEMTLRYEDATERDYFEDGTDFSIEFNNAALGAGVIAATGAWYYGFILRIPKIKLSVRPEAEGGPKDPLTITLTGTVMDDGTNPHYALAVYNGVETYLG